jgi:hypothetical protein
MFAYCDSYMEGMPALCGQNSALLLLNFMAQTRTTFLSRFNIKNVLAVQTTVLQAVQELLRRDVLFLWRIADMSRQRNL